MILPEIEIHFELSCRTSNVGVIIRKLRDYTPIKSVFPLEIQREQTGAVPRPIENVIIGTAVVRFRSDVTKVEKYLKNLDLVDVTNFKPEYTKFFSGPVRRISLTTGLIVGIAILGHNLIVNIHELESYDIDPFVLLISFVTAIIGGAVAFVYELIAMYREF